MFSGAPISIPCRCPLQPQRLHV
uniref:Uncharacterized protein n=1 Tax=Arundo donax TaxID=35708 RepID=A0A0A8Z7F7_ARUDO